MISAGATRAAELFDGPGEMRSLCRAFDWSTTPLGPVSEWPRCLRTTVATMLGSRHAMFLWWGPDLTQIYNDGYRPSFAEGGRHPRALGMRGSEFWTEIWDIIGPQIEQVMSGGEATWHEDHLVPILRNGAIEDVYWTYSYGPAFDDDGNVAGVLVVCQETTQRVLTQRQSERLLVEAEAQRRAAEASRAQMASDVAARELAEAARRESDARYRSLFDSIDSGFCVIEMMFDEQDRPVDYRFLETNPAFEQQTGLVGALGRTARDVLPTLEEHWFATYGRVATTGKPLRFQNGPDPMGRFFDVNAFRTGVPEDRRVALLFTDVTEQVRARRQVERLLLDSEQARVEAERLRGSAEAARQEAEGANRAKSDFLAVMSHELRTPLNAIQGYAELVELGIHGPVTTEQREALRRIQQSQRHLLGLVNGVLNYARVETGNVDFANVDVPLDDTLSTCEALVALQARARQLALAVEGTSSLIVRADPEKLQQIVLNLLSNAIKFTQSGGTITVTSYATETEVLVRISDTGRGIPPAQLGRIFEPFVQVDPSLTRINEGVGLGLAISRDLARGMGGNLSVESEVGVGSTFVLTLPRAA